MSALDEPNAVAQRRGFAGWLHDADPLHANRGPTERLAPSSAAAPLVALDLSRLLRRAWQDTPTGIDRIEHAYAEHLIANDAASCFVALNQVGSISLLRQRRVEAYVPALAELWRGDGVGTGRPGRARRLALAMQAADPLLRGERLLRARLRRSPARPVYLLVSHHHLEHRRAIARLKACGAAFVCLIHDLIPIAFPEYAERGQDRRHRQRVETAAALADGLIVSSTATRDALDPYLRRARRNPPVLVAPFGVCRPPPADPGPPATRPYFVLIGTIEARKNHILALNLWRRFADELGAAAPQLVLIGRRGWLTPHVVDMIERCPALHGLVVERGPIGDAEMSRAISGARAVLLPSFAEGFGLPLVEALALGVPVLCSDLRELRETGGAVPEYLDPLDGGAWRQAILDYAGRDSPRRAAQLRRLAEWRPMGWHEHFAMVQGLLAEVAARPPEPSARSVSSPAPIGLRSRSAAGEPADLVATMWPVR